MLIRIFLYALFIMMTIFLITRIAHANLTMNGNCGNVYCQEENTKTNCQYDPYSHQVVCNTYNAGY